MGHPSLLYLKEPKMRPLETSVFEDLQMLNFIPKSVAKTVRVPCEGENIRARQALFAALEKEENAKAFEELYFLSKKIEAISDSFKNSRCQAERNAAFLFLAEAWEKFDGAAEKAGFGDPLSERFVAALKKEKEAEGFRAMCEKGKALLPELREAVRFSLKVRGDAVFADKETGKGILERILRCVEDLGLSKPKVREIPPHKLSPDLLEALPRLYPALFEALDDFFGEFSPLWNPSLTYYGRELRFYLTMLGFFGRIREAGIPLTYPTLTEKRGVDITEAYDVSLLAKGSEKIIPNDVLFDEKEPFFFLTGANGGGKTTYLRAVGIAALLALNGCPVPAKRAAVGPLSGLYTHFPRDERFDGSGRFVEENARVEKILETADENSLVLLNETYSSTNEENAVRMTEKLAEELKRRRAMGLYITHQHTLADKGIPYLNVLVDPEDANRRTFKIAHQKNAGGSFAYDILLKCRLTPEALEERFGKKCEEEASAPSTPT